MNKIFVSYSSKDSKIANRICAALEAKGLPCWIASRDINPGENFGEAIVSEAKAAPHETSTQYFTMVLSPIPLRLELRRSRWCWWD